MSAKYDLKTEPVGVSQPTLVNLLQPSEDPPGNIPLV